MTDTGRRGFALKPDGSANATHHMHWQDFLRKPVVILGKAEMQFTDRHGLAPPLRRWRIQFRGRR